MAFTRVSDLIVPQIFAPAVLNKALKSNVLMNSGIVARSPSLEAGLRGGGLSFSVANINSVIDQANYAANVPTDVYTDLATPKAINAVSQVARRLERNDHFAFTDLAEEITDTDLTAILVSQATEMVTAWRQKSLLAVLNGAINVTNTPNLVNASGAAFGLAGLLSTFGVFGDSIGAGFSGFGIAMSPASAMARRAAEPNAFIPTSQTNMNLTSYLGMPVLISDDIPNGEMWVFKPGGVTYGVIPVKNPVEVQRETLAGNGGGGTDVGFRDAYTFHITGMSFSGTTAGLIPTDAELATAGNWTKIAADRGIGVAKYTFTV